MVTRQLLVGEFVSGQITGIIQPLDYQWTSTLNEAGSIDSVTIPGSEVTRLGLRSAAAAQRCFLAVEEDGRIRQHGPVQSYKWDSRTQLLTLGAGDFWSYLVRRYVMSQLGNGVPPASMTPLTVSGPDLRSLAVQIIDTVFPEFGNYPAIYTPSVDTTPATLTRTYYGHELRKIADVLQAMTKEQGIGVVDNNAAEPQGVGVDIRFRPIRDIYGAYGSARDHIATVMDTGTAAAPRLSQAGDDWIFDATAPQSPVRGISVDGDGTTLTIYVYAAGAGSGNAVVTDFDFTDTASAMLAAGYPMLEKDIHEPADDTYALLDAHMFDELARSNRPVEAWQVEVSTAAALEVMPGDYCQLIADDTYLGKVDRRMRVQKLTGSYKGDTTTLTMYPVTGDLP